ncbi:LysR family transcriptional regulator [Burkholderia cepacia]|uniref:LysR family transcriptional regulator n=1 Tax=Burkholderia cepacia TaxID=292 RepID=A0A103Z9U2_BURCE|nr:LysR family transcriptional regulator [Burkholderia cepacia]KVK76062.1 LysR family transcriptional regulator [Burkholderia cepacia]
MSDEEDLSLNAVRAFVQIARERSVTRAAKSLGITQSSVSRHLAVLEAYLGSKLIERRGRYSELTEFGRLFADSVGEPLETILFTAQRMRRRDLNETNRLVVRTSLSTFAYTLLVPNLQDFSREMGGTLVDITTSLSMPSSTDGFDVLLTRDLVLAEPSDRWDIHDEQLVCVGAPQNIAGRGLDAVSAMPVLAVTSRPDIMPTWLKAMELKPSDILSGARYDHHYLALPAVTTGRCLLVAPEIVVADLIRQGLLGIVPGTRAPSGMRYRAYAADRSRNPDLAHAFCRWMTQLCKRVGAPAQP